MVESFQNTQMGASMGLKRTITKQEEKLLRLVHQDFGGYSLDNAAAKMDISVKEAKRILSKIEKIMPQLFPILTPQHKAILLMYDKHMSRASIAVALGITEQDLHKEITFLRKHKFLWNRKMDQYDPILDNKVKEKF